MDFVSSKIHVLLQQFSYSRSKKAIILTLFTRTHVKPLKISLATLILAIKKVKNDKKFVKGSYSSLKLRTFQLFNFREVETINTPLPWKTEAFIIKLNRNTKIEQ